MDKTSVDDISRTLSRYSDLHDAEITSLDFSSSNDVLTLVVSAHNYETDFYENLTLTFQRVTQLQILPPPVTDPSMGDYLFPVERTLDAILFEDKNAARVALRGTYGWRLLVDCAKLTVSGASG